MAESRVVMFRCPLDLWAAIESAAKSRGVTTSQVIRRAVGKHLGVEAGDALPVGLSAADEQTRTRVAALGGAASKKDSKPKRPVKKRQK